MNKKIGIRYCGGCNPKYDRVSFVHMLTEAHPDISFVYMDEVEKADTVYIVSGCERDCTRTEDLSGKTVVHITNENCDTFK